MTTSDKVRRIAELNDRERLGLDQKARVVITANCLAALAGDDRLVRRAIAEAEVLAAVRGYVFSPDGGVERDGGDFLLGDHAVRFRIDYYDLSLEWGSEDPADPAVTTRVMTIMLPSDD